MIQVIRAAQAFKARLVVTAPRWEVGAWWYLANIECAHLALVVVVSVPLIPALEYLWGCSNISFIVFLTRPWDLLFSSSVASDTLFNVYSLHTRWTKGQIVARIANTIPDALLRERPRIPSDFRWTRIIEWYPSQGFSGLLDYFGRLVHSLNIVGKERLLPLKFHRQPHDGASAAP